MAFVSGVVTRKGQTFVSLRHASLRLNRQPLSGTGNPPHPQP
jgi:hypothetical protein